MSLDPFPLPVFYGAAIGIHGVKKKIVHEICLDRTLYTKLYDIFPVWCWIHNIEECFGDFKTGLALRSVQGVLMAVPTVWINLETPKIVELLVRMHILSRIFSPRFLLFYDNLNLILTELEEVRKKGMGGWK